MAVDIRVGSPTFGQWIGEVLTAESNAQLYVPPGYAHGFQVLEEWSEVFYKCTDYYSGAADQRGVPGTIRRSGIAWPLGEPLLSEKDRLAAPLRRRSRGSAALRALSLSRFGGHAPGSRQALRRAFVQPLAPVPSRSSTTRRTRYLP